MCECSLNVYHNTDKKTSVGKFAASVAAFETCFNNNEINGSEATMKSLIVHSDKLMNDLQQYFDKHIRNYIFAFWKQHIDMVSAFTSIY